MPTAQPRGVGSYPGVLEQGCSWSGVSHSWESSSTGPHSTTKDRWA